MEGKDWQNHGSSILARKILGNAHTGQFIKCMCGEYAHVMYIPSAVYERTIRNHSTESVVQVYHEYKGILGYMYIHMCAIMYG